MTTKDRYQTQINILRAMLCLGLLGCGGEEDPGSPGGPIGVLNRECTNPAIVLTAYCRTADPDGDGATVEEEVAAETDPLDADTDDDGVLDGEEINGETDPLNPDTDGDTVLDGMEIDVGSSPLNPDSNCDAVNDDGTVDSITWALTADIRTGSGHNAPPEAIVDGWNAAAFSSEATEPGPSLTLVESDPAYSWSDIQTCSDSYFYDRIWVQGLSCESFSPFYFRNRATVAPPEATNLRLVEVEILDIGPDVMKLHFNGIELARITRVIGEDPFGNPTVTELLSTCDGDTQNIERVYTSDQCPLMDPNQGFLSFGLSTGFDDPDAPNGGNPDIWLRAEVGLTYEYAANECL